MRLDPSAASVSDQATCLSDLTEQQQARLTELLDEYLSNLEQGLPVDVPALLREHADIADLLQAYLGQLDQLHGVAMGFQGCSPAQHDSPVPASLRLGDYTIVRELGRGGMGIVYEARQ
ncbi:MAG: serine/threonine protein kinase, partial [Pirellulales bacterium]|nr:serine/threonine protein kinase [Pirellulales bacterium]